MLADSGSLRQKSVDPRAGSQCRPWVLYSAGRLVSSGSSQLVNGAAVSDPPLVFHAVSASPPLVLLLLIRRVLICVGNPCVL